MVAKVISEWKLVSRDNIFSETGASTVAKMYFSNTDGLHVDMANQLSNQLPVYYFITTCNQRLVCRLHRPAVRGVPSSQASPLSPEADPPAVPSPSLLSGVCSAAPSSAAGIPH